MAFRLSGDPEERRQTIARATCRAIVEQGLHHMNLRDIARALGTTTGPLQHYFRNKDELLVYTKNLLIDDMLSQARQAGQRVHGVQRLWVVCEELLPIKPAAREAWLVLTAFNGRAIGDEQLSAVQVSRYSKCRRFFSDEITLACENGTLDGPVDVPLESLALVSFVTGIAVHMLFLSATETRLVKQSLRRYLERNLGLDLRPVRAGRRPPSAATVPPSTAKGAPATAGRHARIVHARPTRDGNNW